MTHDDDLQDLPFLDERAGAAAQGLRAHVRHHVDVEAALDRLPGGRPVRTGSRVAALAAVAALFVAVVAVANIGRDASDDAEERAMDDLHTGVLRPLGPRDGKDSIRLPVTVEPGTELHDGDVVSVTASGFVPGENVGIVQCAREAGGEVRDQRAGVDGCEISGYTAVTADGDGVATGTYAVRRVLTTPATGTVDCASEAERCLLGIGAIDDYDRSGGKGIQFATDVPPVELPTASATPTEGLQDGDRVSITVDGVGAGEVLQVELCASDPLVCWQTGEEVEVAQDGERYRVRGVQADDGGHAEADVPVWRFLPGPEPSTFVDCAISRCSLRIHGETAPPSIPLQFTADGAVPDAPVLGVDRTTGLQPGDELFIQGSNLTPGVTVGISICVLDPSMPDHGYVGCWSDDGPTSTADGDGSFTTTFEIDAEVGLPPEDMARCSVATCETFGGERVPLRCDGVEQQCLIVADVYSDVEGHLPLEPVFSPAPVPISFG